MSRLSERYRDLFPAVIQGSVQDGMTGAWRHAWSEVTPAGYDAYVSPPDARYGTTSIDYALELNNARAADGWLVWLRHRDESPEVHFEFDCGCAGACVPCFSGVDVTGPALSWIDPAGGWRFIDLTGQTGTVIVTSGVPSIGAGGGGGGSGTVTSVTAGSGLTGGTITTSGTIALAVPVALASGGTGATTAGAALAALGGAPAARLITTTAPLAGGGDLSADRTLSVSAFTASAGGVVPASGGGTANFLRADGTWSAPAGGSVFGPAGGTHSSGLAPDPGATAHTGGGAVPYLLRDSATWAPVPGTILGTSFVSTNESTSSGTGVELATPQRINVTVYQTTVLKVTCSCVMYNGTVGATMSTNFTIPGVVTGQGLAGYTPPSANAQNTVTGTSTISVPAGTYQIQLIAATSAGTGQFYNRYLEVSIGQ